MYEDCHVASLLAMTVLGRAHLVAEDDNERIVFALTVSAESFGLYPNVPRNSRTASLKASGWSRLAAWPASGMTVFVAFGIFLAM